jgi:hypothetical protein
MKGAGVALTVPRTVTVSTLLQTDRTWVPFPRRALDSMGDGGLQRQLAKLERDLGSMRRRLNRSSSRARRSDGLYERKRHVAAEILAALIDRTILAPDGSPIQDGIDRGDLITWRAGPFLVSRVSPRFVGGFYVGGGTDAWPARRADRSWISGIVRKATPALLAALEYREALDSFYGDETWRALIAEALR